MLTSFGNRKIAVIKAVRRLTGLGLKEAKELVESAPTIMATGLSERQAQEYCREIEEAGGQARVIQS